MNTSSTFTTAMLRGLYLAIGAGLSAGLTAYATSDDERAAILTGLITALAALGFRGGVEGGFDARRQANDNVKPSDVNGGG